MFQVKHHPHQERKEEERQLNTLNRDQTNWSRRLLWTDRREKEMVQLLLQSVINFTSDPVQFAQYSLYEMPPNRTMHFVGASSRHGMNWTGRDRMQDEDREKEGK